MPSATAISDTPADRRGLAFRNRRMAIALLRAGTRVGSLRAELVRAF
jgi:hypothetical protein